MKFIFWIIFTPLFQIVLSLVLSITVFKIYVKKKINALILLSTFIVVFCVFSLIFLVPCDLSIFTFIEKNLPPEVKEQKNTNENIEVEILNFYFKYDYLFIFFMVSMSPNLILRQLVAYEESGEFNTCRRIKETISKTFFMSIVFIVLYGLVLLIARFLQVDVINFLVCINTMFNSIFAFIYIGHGISKLPRQFFLYSNPKKTLEYYEFKVNCKKTQLDKNRMQLIQFFNRCKATFNYIKKVKKFLKNNQEIDDDEIEMMENEENSVYLETEDSNNSEKDNKKNPKDKKLITKYEIKKDYLKHMDIINQENFIIIIYNKIFDNKDIYNIEINKYKEDEKIKERPVRSYKSIVKLHAKVKKADRTDERTKIQINRMYKKWQKLKAITINNEKIPEKKSENQNDIDESLNDENFIPPSYISPKKINFYKRYHKIIFILLMIFFTLLGILVIAAEVTLAFPINTKFFYERGPWLLIFMFLLFIVILFYFASYSLIKIQYGGKKYCICTGKETDAASLALFCHSIAKISFPICVNAIQILSNENDEFNVYLIENFNHKLHIDFLHYIIPFVPLFLVFVIILNFFNICGKYGIRKKKKHFAIRNVETIDYIKEGKKYLMEINHGKNIQNLGNIVV